MTPEVFLIRLADGREIHVDSEPELLAVLERLIEERDTGRPDPTAWIGARNAVRRATEVGP